MNKFFGKSKEEKDSPNEAIKKLRDVKEMLDKKQLFIEKKIEIEIQNAKLNGLKNKRGYIPFKCYFRINQLFSEC